MSVLVDQCNSRALLCVNIIIRETEAGDRYKGRVYENDVLICVFLKPKTALKNSLLKYR